MSMDFTVDPAARRCVIRLRGVIHRVDLLAGIREQVAAGAWTWETLIDTSQATEIATGYEDTRAVLGSVEVAARELLPRGPVVIVVDRSGAIYGMARQYQTASEGLLRIEIVSNLDEAEIAFIRMRAKPATL